MKNRRVFPGWGGKYEAKKKKKEAGILTGTNCPQDG
jgi:hypothetical protein